MVALRWSILTLLLVVGAFILGSFSGRDRFVISQFTLLQQEEDVTTPEPIKSGKDVKAPDSSEPIKSGKEDVKAPDSGEPIKSGKEDVKAPDSGEHVWSWQEELLRPEDIAAIKAKWSHLTEQTTNVLDEMLATRNEKIKRYANETKVALLAIHDVDQRLGPVLLLFRKVLPPDWKFQIYHSPENAEWIKTVPAVQQVRATLNMLMPANLSYLGYSDFMRTEAFWETALGDNILTFQPDTVLCPNSPFKIHDFMIYDYIGAPWAHALSNCGNGGLSFRHKSTMLFILRNTAPGGTQEDSFFCNALGHASYRGIIKPLQPHYNVSRCFSVETYPSEVPMGIHGPGKYFGNSGEALYSFCPEARIATMDKKNQPPSRR